MGFGNIYLIRGIVLLFCFGYVQNKRKIKEDTADISDWNSDIYLNSLQLIVKYGFSPQEHLVVTDDNYIVNLVRIPKDGPPVLLVHGIGDSSDSWLVLGPDHSLAYQLSKSGYDVWIYNARGNKYSNRHAGTPSRKQYWNFSFEEMGNKDLPAIIDHILKTTSQVKLSYVGFSQGTTIFFVMCSMRPEYNQKIKHATLLAPIAWVNDIKYPFIDILSKNLDPLKIFFDEIGIYEAFSDNKLMNLYHAKVCRVGSPAEVLCRLEYYISYGLRSLRNLVSRKLPVIASHIPAGVSSKTFYHFIQGYATKKFQRFHYGAEENQMVYGEPQPPQYDLSLVSAPVTLIVSEVDWFSTVSNGEMLKSKLPNVVRYVLLNESLHFTHLEFIYGSRVRTIINEPIIKMLNDDKQ